MSGPNGEANHPPSRISGRLHAVAETEFPAAREFLDGRDQPQMEAVRRFERRTGAAGGGPCVILLRSAQLISLQDAARLAADSTKGGKAPWRPQEGRK